MRKAINLYQLVHQAGKGKGGEEGAYIPSCQLLFSPPLSLGWERIRVEGEREARGREGGGRGAKTNLTGIMATGRLEEEAAAAVATAAGAATAGGRPWQPWKEPEKRAERRE